MGGGGGGNSNANSALMLSESESLRQLQGRDSEFNGGEDGVYGVSSKKSEPDVPTVHEIHVDNEKVAKNYHVCSIEDGQVHICDANNEKSESNRSKKPVFTLSIGKKGVEGTLGGEEVDM